MTDYSLVAAALLTLCAIGLIITVWLAMREPKSRSKP